jgi:hypothetical protein
MGMIEHTSRELSQRLHEKGFRAEHAWSWMISCIDGKPFCGDNENSIAHKRICPAYTFSELWGRVPKSITVNEHWRPLDIYPTDKGEICFRYYQITPFNKFKHESPAEAIGLLLEWLLDNGHYEGREDG